MGADRRELRAGAALLAVMRIRLLLVTGVLVAALVAPTASFAGGNPAYEDAFAATTYCKALAKRNVVGGSRVPFRKCVNAIRAMKRNRRLAATRACRSESTRRIVRFRGTRRSPRYLCVRAGRTLRRDGTPR